MIFAGFGRTVLIFTDTADPGFIKGLDAYGAESATLAENPMRDLKSSGRERAVLRAIDPALGSTAEEINLKTSIDLSELADILNGLFAGGFVEFFDENNVPLDRDITDEDLAKCKFEVNPAYALD